MILRVPATDEERVAQTNGYLQTLLAMTNAEMAAGRNPIYLFQSMLGIIGHHLDMIVAPGMGDDVLDRLCVRLARAPPRWARSLS